MHGTRALSAGARMLLLGLVMPSMHHVTLPLVTLLALGTSGCSTAVDDASEEQNQAVEAAGPRVLASDSPYAAGLQVDDKTAYWVSGGVVAVPVGGGAARTILPGPTARRTAAPLAASDGQGGVYCRSPQSVVFFRQDSGAFLPAAELRGTPDNMAAAAGRLWSVNFSSDGKLELLTSDHGAPSTVAARLTRDRGYDGMAATDAGVFLAHRSSGTISFFSRKTSTLADVATVTFGTFDRPLLVAASAETAFWASPSDGSVWLGAVGKPARKLASSRRSDGLTSPIAADQERVYWVDNTDIVSVRWPIGNDRRVLATGQSNVTALAVNATSVIWSISDHGKGSVLAVDKPR